MDRYRESFLKAQRKAAEVILLKKNNFLNGASANDIVINQNTYVPEIHKWYRVDGFRAKESEADSRSAVRNAAFGWLRSANANCSAFVLANVAGEISVLYGTGGSNDTVTVFSSVVPECRIQQTEWSGYSYEFNGLMTGTMASSQLADTLASMQGRDFYVACVVVPASDDEIWDKIRENEAMICYLEEHKAFQRVYGNASRRVEEIPIPEVVRAIAVLKEENQFLTNNAGAGFARSCVRFGASDRDTYRRLASVLRSCMNYSTDNQYGYEPVRIVDISHNHHSRRDCLAVPRVNILAQTYYGCADTVSWQTLQSLADFCSMPVNSYNGFYVRNYAIDNNSLNVFPLVRSVTDNGINVGAVNGSANEAVIPLSALYSHTFVTGATRSGKTTTVKKIIKSLYDKGIPSLIIEAAKKEYIQLLPLIPDLRIFTPGTDGYKFVFNPLQVEDGVLIETHVDAVVRAITAASAGEHPIPEALEGLLKQTYEKAGWKYGMMAYKDSHKPFPIFKDAFDNIPSYIKQHALYGPEVKQNLEGALTLRTENLYTGALGSAFSEPFGLTAKDLLETPTVIELSDFSRTGVEFLMNILLFRLHAYVSRLPESRQLKRVIVVEEAHNVFRKTLSEESTRAGNNDYFEKMLAEISSSGTGMILCDQRPGVMSDAVLANSSVRVVHSLNLPQDKAVMASAMGLSEAQKDRLGELDKGICLIGIRGIFGVQHTRVEPLPDTGKLNPACHICSCRFRCRRASVTKLLEAMEPAKIRYHLSKFEANPYNSALLSANIDRMLKDLNVSAASATKCCLLGMMLLKFGSISYQESRVIVNSYRKYLKGGI